MARTARQEPRPDQERTNDLFDWIAANDAIYHLGAIREQVSAEWAREQQAQGSGSNSPIFIATAQALYARNLWPYLAEGMRDYHTDPRNTTFLGFLTNLGQREDPTSGWVYDAIICNEGQTGLDPAALAATVFDSLSGAGGDKTGADSIRSGITCARLAAIGGSEASDGGKLAIPPLVLPRATETPPPTPAAGGPAMAAALHGWLIRVGGGDHGVFGRGNRQLDIAVLDYLETGTVTMTRATEPARSARPTLRPRCPRPARFCEPIMSRPHITSRRKPTGPQHRRGGAHPYLPGARREHQLLRRDRGRHRCSRREGLCASQPAPPRSKRR